METLRFYTKPDCPLCDRVRDILDETDAVWEEVNILENQDLWRHYRHEIPVIQSTKGIWLYRDESTTPLVQWLRKHG